MHLRNINPYVETSFSDWKKTHYLTPFVPRVHAPQSIPSSQLVGTSSFGMSGVNAHALFSSSSTEPPSKELEAAPSASDLLHRKRTWPLVPALYMAAQFIGWERSARCTISINLAQPALAFLADHQVRLVLFVGNKDILYIQKELNCVFCPVEGEWSCYSASVSYV